MIIQIRIPLTVVRLLILQKIPKTVRGSDTTDNTDIQKIIQRILQEDYGTEDSGDLDYTEDGSGTGSDNGDSSSDTSGGY